MRLQTVGDTQRTDDSINSIFRVDALIANAIRPKLFCINPLWLSAVLEKKTYGVCDSREMRKSDVSFHFPLVMVFIASVSILCSWNRVLFASYQNILQHILHLIPTRRLIWIIKIITISIQECVPLIKTWQNSQQFNITPTTNECTFNWLTDRLTFWDHHDAYQFKNGKKGRVIILGNL